MNRLLRIHNAIYTILLFALSVAATSATDIQTRDVTQHFSSKYIGELQEKTGHPDRSPDDFFINLGGNGDDSFNAGIRHSAIIHAGYADITVFMQPDRYSVKKTG